MALFWSEVLTAKYNDLHMFTMSILKKNTLYFELFNELYLYIFYHFNILF